MARAKVDSFGFREAASHHAVRAPLPHPTKLQLQYYLDIIIFAPRFLYMLLLTSCS